MKVLNVPLGLLMNFHQMKLTNGTYRLILAGADKELAPPNETPETETPEF